MRKLLFLPAIALGVIALVLMARNAKTPERAPVREVARRVRVIEVPALDLVPRVVGFGVVRPGRVWQAMPEVTGRVVEMDERLREGNIFKKDALLLRIDRSDYDIEVAEADAQLLSIAAELGQLDARRKTLESSLAIEQQSLELTKGERDRIALLVERESIPAATLDAEKRKVLTQTARVQEIHNALSLVEPDRGVLEAKKSIQQTRRDKALLNVARTTIRAPFDCRIGEVHVELDQVVQKGGGMFSADSIATSEVTAQVPLAGVGHVFPVSEVPIDATQGLQQALLDMGLSAKVRLQNGQRIFEWDASVTRIEGIDPQTRTVGIVVSVEGSYEHVRPATQPPLVRGMYVEVIVRGTPRPDVVVVPRSALHSGRVYVIDDESRLAVREVEVGVVQSGFATIRAGLKAGERIVLSDVLPAVPGMLLDPETDEGAAEELAADATGRTSMR